MKIICFGFVLSAFLISFSVHAIAQDGAQGETINQSISAESSQVQCHQFPKYFIVAKDEADNMGTDILVKYKSGPEENPPCEYVIENSDFEIKNEWAEYFAGVKGDLLLLDSTTGPGPTLFTIWDLKKQEKVYVGSWADPVFQDDSVLYWMETGAATKDNCPDLKKWESHGLGGAIETKVLLSLSDFTITKTRETRCSARQ
ncbi:MAG: hypothetical protein ABIJ42_10510 [Acidobacteriota bacterium]